MYMYVVTAATFDTMMYIPQMPGRHGQHPLRAPPWSKGNTVHSRAQGPLAGGGTHQYSQYPLEERPPAVVQQSPVSD